MISAVTGRMISARIERIPATSTFCRSKRIRGIGMASRYRSDDHDASDATVSPKNSEMITISRKLAEKNSDTMAKLIRGIGMASRYRSDDHDASDATVSPKNSEMITISRKLAEKNSDTMAKLIAPD